MYRTHVSGTNKQFVISCFLYNLVLSPQQLSVPSGSPHFSGHRAATFHASLYKSGCYILRLKSLLLSVKWDRETPLTFLGALSPHFQQSWRTPILFLAASFLSDPANFSTWPPSKLVQFHNKLCK